MTVSVSEVGKADRRVLMSVSGNTKCEVFPAHYDRDAVGWLDMEAKVGTDMPLACGYCTDEHRMKGGKVLRDLRGI
jgi:TPP-dependent pyruvate/acetoin dehydrogenase alpha subunit